MLRTSVLVFNPTLVSGTTYTFELYYSPASAAKFTRYGDVVTDTADNRFEIKSPTTLPVTDGAVVTVEALDAVAPVEDGDYDSFIETPGQLDSRPAVSTGGTLDTATLLSGPNFTYTVTASWSLSASANASVVGDRLIDSNGKAFEIVSFNNPTTKWSTSVVITEVEKVGIAPGLGQASLYRPTSNSKFYQGTAVTDPARTVAQNRDAFYLDAELEELGQGGGGSGEANESTFSNNSGGTIAAFMPVRSHADGIASVDVSDEAQATSVLGITKTEIADAASGVVVTAGRLTNITTSANVNDPIFISKTGELTNTKPEIGVDSFAAGDWIIVIGTIVKNESNPSLKDLLININISGQL